LIIGARTGMRFMALPAQRPFPEWTGFCPVMEIGDLLFSIQILDFFIDLQLGSSSATVLTLSS
jgi:hypothetical protein